MRIHLLPENCTFYKANLHCHSTISDGQCTVEELKEGYRNAGYSIIAFTDHDALIGHNDLTDDTFLALNGYEMEINEPGHPWPETKTCHMCLIALEPDNLTQVCYHRAAYLFGNAPKYREQIQFDPNQPDFVRHYTPECLNDMFRVARENGFFVTYNHPTWSLETPENYMNYHGMNAMEVVNYGCVNAGFDDVNPRVYDDMLRGGEKIICIAADDNHARFDVANPDTFGGFTMIAAPKLEYRAVTAALSAGHTYASMGPEIQELYYEDGRVYIKTSPAREISYHPYTRNCRCAKKKGELITEASFAVAEGERFFRLEVTDAQGKRAFTNAYFPADFLPEEK